MSQDIEMQTENRQWLSLANYASKYNVSVSTLRRRIKTDAIDFKLHDGKYFLQDSAPEQKISFSEEAMRKPVAQEEEPVIASATKLLAELKKAYTSVLHDKEEQLIQLKEEVSDLKMLVRVLESDNDRLKKLLYSEN